MAVAEWIVRIVGAYAGLGVVFAVPFVIWGVGRIDPGARGTPWGFRVLIAPGVVALWPWLLARVMKARPAEVHP